MPVRRPPRLGGELLEVVDGAPLLGAVQLCVRDGGGQAVVALLPSGEDEQVRARGIGLAVLRLRQLERELRTEDRLHLEGFGRLGEAHDAVEPVVIGDREGVQAQPLRLLGELLG